MERLFSRKILLLPLLLLTLTAQAEVELKIMPMADSDMQYAVSLVGQIRFANEVMCLYDKAGVELGCTPVADINQIVFNEIADALSENYVSVSVYPNPASEFLVIKGVPANQTIRVYDLQGRLVLSTSTETEATTICVKDLQNGEYLLQLGAEFVKLLKK